MGPIEGRRFRRNVSPVWGPVGIVVAVDVGDVAECYEKHAGALVRFAASMVGPIDADDVVATAVVSVLAADLDRVLDLRSYLYRATANAARKHWRTIERRGRRDRFAVVALVHDDEDFPVDTLRRIAQLSAQQRAVVHLAYWEDLSPALIAERLGVSEGTVRRQLARARRRLREVMNPDG